MAAALPGFAGAGEHDALAPPGNRAFSNSGHGYSRGVIQRYRRLAWLVVYAIAMAFLESAVVVYLRAIYYPDGFQFPLRTMATAMVWLEIGRETATIVMLLAVARLAGMDAWEWFLALCVSFGMWDIFYYVSLLVFIQWPPSLLTWDVLFLIPLPWVAPVLAPLIVSAGLIVGALWLWRLKSLGVRLRFSRGVWSLAVAGGVVVLLSFMLDSAAVLRGQQPPPFRWGLFLAGAGGGGAALVLGVRRLERSRAGRER